MKKILALAGLALALSGCVVIVDPGTQASLTSVGLTAPDYQNSAGTEYYICGNKNALLTVSFTYTGTFNSYTIALIGDNNGENPSLPRFGPFTFNALNGDTATSVSRVISLSTSDPKPTNNDRITTQAVVVTPVPQDFGLGSFKARVFLTSDAGTVQQLSSQTVKVFGNTSSYCQ